MLEELLSSGFSALLPVLNARMIDDCLYSADEVTKKIIRVILLAVLIGVTQLLSVLFNIVSQRTSNKVSCNLSADLRLAVYDKVQRLSLTSMSRKT